MVQSVARSIEALRLLASAPRGLGVTEIAERIGVAKPTAHALLRTLESAQMVVQDADSAKYRLGPLLLELGNAFLETHELRTRSVVWADTLATRVNEAVWVAVLSGDHVLVVHHAFRPEGAVQILEVGAVVPWHACALGKAIVAHVPEQQRTELLGRSLPMLTGRTLTEQRKLAAELEKVRSLGYAVEDSEATIGDAGLAAPVFARDGVAGAIGLVGPVERLLAGQRDEYAVAVRDTARLLTRDLGGGRPTLRRLPLEEAS
jgi:DNA-binding IclR family transcriptional regulator